MPEIIVADPKSSMSPTMKATVRERPPFMVWAAGLTE
jgi:hypothetical protein